MTTPEHVFLVTLPLVLAAFFVGRVWEICSSMPRQEWLFRKARKALIDKYYEKQMREAAQEEAEMWRKHAKALEDQARKAEVSGG